MKKLSLLAIAAAATVLVSCGNKGGRPNFGDNVTTLRFVRKSVVSLCRLTFMRVRQ